MRNNLFVAEQAEYMTRERFKELGLSKSDIGERDTQFGVNRRQEEVELPEDAVEHVAGHDGTYAAPLPVGESLPGIEPPAPAVEVEQLAVSFLVFFWRHSGGRLATNS